MKTPWPRSLARQTLLLLGLGMGGVLVLALGVSSIRSLREARVHGEHDEGDRLVPLALALDASPPELRARLLDDAARLGVRHVQYAPGQAPPPIHSNGFTRGLQRRIAGELRPFPVHAEAAGHLEERSLLEDLGPLYVRFALADGTRVDLALPGSWSTLDVLGETGPMVAVLAGGLILLALRVSRRVTRPLGEFTRAAVRLGQDVHAPALAEEGPSELRALASAFNQMQRQLVRLLEDRRLMLSAVSHDLRTPITRLRLRAEFIDDATARERTLADLAEMEAMIASMLALARDDTAREPLEAVDATSLLERVAEELRELGHAVTLESAPPQAIAARPLALKRAVRNLVENAAKYGGSARIRVGGTNDVVTIDVEDDGPGLSEADLERVFLPFFRAEPSRSRETGGTGLGLTVARTVLRSHGGDVVLSNRPGGGLLQRVTLPRGDLTGTRAAGSRSAS